MVKCRLFVCARQKPEDKPINNLDSDFAKLKLFIDVSFTEITLHTRNSRILIKIRKYGLLDLKLKNCTTRTNSAPHFLLA